MLEVYSYIETDKEEMGIVSTYVPNEYEKVLRYINQRGYDHALLGIPVLHLGETSDKYDFWIIFPDCDATFDNYGDPLYFGLYHRRLPDKQSTFKLTRDELPVAIFEGTLDIGKKQPRFTPSEPQRMIYSQEKYSCLRSSTVV